MKFRSHAKILVIALLALCSVSICAQSAEIAVESVGMTVSDMDRSVEFYSALTFQKVSDIEVFGERIRTSGRRFRRADADRADATRK